MPREFPTVSVPVVMDPRLIRQIVDFSGEVAEVAVTLTNLGLDAEAGRLLAALDRLDADPDG
jgi:hypothetical protein